MGENIGGLLSRTMLIAAFVITLLAGVFLFGSLLNL